MGRDLGDVIARARGLGTRFLPPETLDDLRRAQDLRVLAVALADRGVIPAEAPLDALTLDHAIRRHAAERLRLLRRWAGARAATLAIVFDDEDRRSLRALVRACVAAAPLESRLAGLIPTATFPERALHELARQPTLSAMAGLLAAWRNPYADALRVRREAEPPDLARLETAISRRFFRTAKAGARGDRELEAYVATLVDLENAWTALALAGDAEGEDRHGGLELFLPGGDALAAERFVASTRAEGVAAARALLATAFAGGAVADAFDPAAAEPERAALEGLIRHAARRRRLAPLSSAAVIEFALRQRRETIALAEILWTLALAVGEPAA